MWNFCQFWNAVNGEPYTDGVPPPVKYDIADLTTGPINGTEDGSYELRPITDEDTARYAAPDVIAAYVQMHDKNPLRLGDPMSDDEFKKFYGHTW
jgi:hypothetical protein